MMTRQYKDYQIVVSKFYNNIGYGFRAGFSIPKADGTREYVQCYETYRRASFEEVFDDVYKIIDALG